MKEQPTTVPNGSLIVVYLVEPRQPGDRFRRTRLDWPLHITLVPWFSVKSETAVIPELDSLVSNYPQFPVTVGQDAMFGPDKNIPVSIVATPEPCRKLQDILVKALRYHGAIFASERWIGAEYRPHITHHGSRRDQAGDTEHVRSITLVRLADQQTCEVVRHFTLKGNHETAS